MESSLPNAVGYWRKFLRDENTQELLALAEQVEELQSTPGFVGVMRLVAQARETLVRGITEGPTRSDAQYARLAGNIAGLDDLQHVCTAIAEAAATRRAQEEQRIAAESRAEEEETP